MTKLIVTSHTIIFITFLATMAVYAIIQLANMITMIIIIITFLMVAIMVQFVVGVFSFLLLLCCESATAGFRAALVPVLTTSVPST